MTRIEQATRIWDITRIDDRAKCRMELTSLVRFRDAWYCGFHEGEIHDNHPSGRARIIRCADGRTWQTVALFAWEGADVREPRLSVTSCGHLMANTSVFFVSRKPRNIDAVNGAYLPPEAVAANQPQRVRYFQLDQQGTPASEDEAGGVARQSVTWLSPNGSQWSTAYACPTGVNTWRWDVAWHHGMGYSVAYDGKDKRGTLYRTRDGKSWRVLLTDFFPNGKGNETALAFGPDDTAYALLRDGPTRVMLGISPPPYYTQWQWMPLDIDFGPEHGGPRPADEVLKSPFGGPKLLCLRDGRLVAAGRVVGPDHTDGSITLFLLDPQHKRLTRIVDFSGTSYPGLAEHDGQLWLTYGDHQAANIYFTSVALPPRAAG